MMTKDRTFYSWATHKNADGTFDAIVTMRATDTPRVELKRVPCRSRDIAKRHAIKWCRYLIAVHDRDGRNAALQSAA